MTRQIYIAPTVTTARSVPIRLRPEPGTDAHSQFLPADRATQILLQQFL